jgi:hypothetical protein
VLLPELIDRYSDAEAGVHFAGDEDYQGFGKVPRLAEQTLGPRDLLLVDAGAKGADPWAALDLVPEGGRVAVAVPGKAADLPMGQVVQALVAHDIDLVEVVELEQVYNRQVALVGVRGGEQPGAARVRRLSWEWACLDLLGRAQAERTRLSDERFADRIAQLEGELASARARIGELERALASSKQAIARLANSVQMRVGKAVVRAKRHPVGAAKDLSSEIMASRKRK